MGCSCRGGDAATALPGDPACTAGPCLDIGLVPDPTGGKDGDGLGKVCPAGELVDALIGDAEELGDFGGTHEPLIQL